MSRDLPWAPVVSQIVVGSWLVVSGFLWPHGAEQFVVALMSGLLCMLFGVWALGNPRRSYGNQLVALWLLVGPPAARNHRVTLINHVLAAAAILGFSRLSLVPSGDSDASRGG